MSWHKYTKNFFFTLIVLSLSIPSILLIIAASLWPLPDFSLTEKRQLAGIPDTPKTFAELKSLTKNFDLFYSDQYLLKENLIELSNNILYKIGSKEIDSVIVGEHPWLFLNHQNLIEQYQYLDYLSESDLNAWQDYLTSRQEWLASKGIKYLFVIVPNKHTVYPEFLPKRLAGTMKHSSRKTLLNHLKKNSNINYLDLSETLISAKTQSVQLLYEPTGTHWNSFGANFANNEILSRVSNLITLKETKRYDADDFLITPRKGFELSTWINQDDKYSDITVSLKDQGSCTDAQLIENPYKICDFKQATWCAPQKINCPTASYSALVFRDSFYRKLQPLFAPNFSESVYILNDRSMAVLKYYTEAYEPDIVIEQMVERNIFKIPSTQ